MSANGQPGSGVLQEDQRRVRSSLSYRGQVNDTTEFRLLEPLEVWVGGHRQRELLTALLLQAN